MRSVIHVACTNVTTSPMRAFNTMEKIFTGFAAAPTLCVWALVYYYSPKKNFRLNNPYHHMQRLYALMSGFIIGQLLGHALPNATLYTKTDIPFLAAIFGVFSVIAFLKLCRVYGYAKNQVIGSTQYEPIELYNDNGEETEYVVLAEEEFILDGAGGEGSSMLAEDDTPMMSAAQSVLTVNDAYDVRWIRRRMFELLYVTSCVMVMFEGPYLSYNASGVLPMYAIPAFYVMKIIQAFMLSCYAVFAYNHKREKKFLFLSYYTWAALIFGVVCAMSTIPVMLDILRPQITVLVESRIFSGFYEYFAGVLAAVAFNFISREEYKPTKMSEIIWLSLFGIGAFSVWGLGLVI